MCIISLWRFSFQVNRVLNVIHVTDAIMLSFIFNLQGGTPVQKSLCALLASGGADSLKDYDYRWSLLTFCLEIFTGPEPASHQYNSRLLYQPPDGSLNH